MNSKKMKETAFELENMSEATGNIATEFSEDGTEPNKEKKEQWTKLEQKLDEAAKVLREAAELQKEVEAISKERLNEILDKEKTMRLNEWEVFFETLTEEEKEAYIAADSGQER